MKVQSLIGLSVRGVHELSIAPSDTKKSVPKKRVGIKTKKEVKDKEEKKDSKVVLDIGIDTLKKDTESSASVTMLKEASETNEDLIKTTNAETVVTTEHDIEETEGQEEEIVEDNFDYLDLKNYPNLSLFYTYRKNDLIAENFGYWDFAVAKRLKTLSATHGLTEIAKANKVTEKYLQDYIDKYNSEIEDDRPRLDFYKLYSLLDLNWSVHDILWEFHMEVQDFLKIVYLYVK